MKKSTMLLFSVTGMIASPANGWSLGNYII